MCITWFPEPIHKRNTHHAPNAFIRKFYGFMSLRAGSSLACTLWIAINIYGFVLAIQGQSPIFSYLDSTALKVQAAMCALFIVIAVITLQGLYGDSLRILYHAHRLVFLAVLLFMADFLGNIVISGLQRDTFNRWCVDQSRSVGDESISATLSNGTSVSISLSRTDYNIYNCDRLWVHEFEFSIILLVVFFFNFFYWAICIWSYHQKLMITRTGMPQVPV